MGGADLIVCGEESADGATGQVRSKQTATLVWKNREHYDTILCSFKYPKGFLVAYETRLGNASMRARQFFTVPTVL
jgi:hypothetical protein